MNKKYFIYSIPFLILLSGVCAAAGLIWAMGKSPEKKKVERDFPLVETQEVLSYSDGLTLEAQGEVVPYREVSLAAEVPGRIAWKNADSLAGRYVEEGQLLIELDVADYDLEVKRVQQSIKENLISVEEVDIQKQNNAELLDLAQQELEIENKDLERIRSLHAQRATSKATLDEAEQSRIRALNAVQLQQNQARVLDKRRARLLQEKERLLVELEKAELDLRRTKVVSPMDGVIVEDPVEEGDFVQRGALLFRIEDISKVEVDFDLKLEELQWIWSGEAEAEARTVNSFALPPLPVDVVLNIDGRRYAWTGVLDRYDGAGLNAATRTIPCVAVVSEHRGKFEVGPDTTEGQGDSDSFGKPPALMNGMFVSVRIPNIRASQSLIEIPITALRPGNKVWLLEDGVLRVRTARVAQLSDDRVYLLANESGVGVGDQVIVSPLVLAVDGMHLMDSAAGQGETASAGLEKLR